MPFPEILISTTVICSINGGVDLTQRREKERTTHLLAARKLCRDANFRQLVNLRKLNLGIIQFRDFYFHLSMAQTKSGPLRILSAHGDSLSKSSAVADRVGMQTSMYYP